MKNSLNGILLTLALSVSLSINYISGNIYYYNFDENGTEFLTEVQVELINDKNIEDNIKYTLECLFNNDAKMCTLIPENVNINKILYINGDLEIEVSDEILDYGGTQWEEGMINQILATVFSIKEINTFTLKIEKNRDFLVEGTVINGYTRKEWEEKKLKMKN